jgi:virulence-associated protein VagC
MSSIVAPKDWPNGQDVFVPDQDIIMILSDGRQVILLPAGNRITFEDAQNRGIVRGFSIPKSDVPMSIRDVSDASKFPLEDKVSVTRSGERLGIEFDDLEEEKSPRKSRK